MSFAALTSALCTLVISPPPLTSQWTATDGFNDRQFITFDADRYRGMVNDHARTSAFTAAIQKAVLGREGDLVVLDIGTGPEALLALIAARAGAKKVFAIEAQPEVAEMARRAVAASGVGVGVVEVIEGFSTDIELPEKADLLVAEIVGSVASEEGIYATMFDAQRRHLRDPFVPASYIPLAVETLAAPMSYALHHPALGPKGFDWDAVRIDGPPPRFACSTHVVKALSEPLRFEVIRFDVPLPPPGSRLETALTFEMSADRMHAASQDYAAILVEAGMPRKAADEVASDVAHSVTGVGFWPRLIMDEDETLVVDSRAADGSAQRSHWQTVLPLLCSQPQRVAAGDLLVLHAVIDLGEEIDEPVRYALECEIRREAPTRDSAPMAQMS